MADGGRTALSGFLSQIIAGWGMQAWALDAFEPSDQSELDAVIELVRNKGVIRHEGDDQDLVIEQQAFGVDEQSEHILVQFKCSRQHPPKPLGKSDLVKIRTSFRRSLIKVVERGKHVSRLLVISNRPLQISTATSKRSSKSSPSSISPTTYSEVIDSIPLQVIAHFPEGIWGSKLELFARQYGCLDDEIEHGIDSLIGNLIQRTVNDGATQLDAHYLAAAFCHFRDPQPLTFSTIRPKEVKHTEHLKRQLAVTESPIERTVIRELDQLTRERALIVITGRGGLGKTVALYEWIAQQQSRTGNGDSLAVLRTSKDILGNFVGGLSAQWVNDLHRASSRANDSISQVLERLQRANPSNSHPILYFGLDGLDETQDPFNLSASRTLIRWFWEQDQRCLSHSTPPLATLIMTCRDKGAFMREWLPLDLSDRSLFDQFDLAWLKMHRFEREELEAGAQREAPELLELLQSDEGPYGNPQVSYANGRYTAESPSGAIRAFSPGPARLPSPILELLRYPILWRAYLIASPPQRQLILAGDDVGHAVLAAHYIHRFCYKAHQRGCRASPAELGDMLKEVAQICPAREQPYFNNQWEQAMGQFPLPDRQLLREEAVSAGLIEGTASPGEWRWGHTFLCTYLASRGGSEIYHLEQSMRGWDQDA